MFFIDQPYVSNFLKETLREYSLPVVNTTAAQSLGLLEGTNLVDESAAINGIRNTENPRIYCSSENSIGWITEHLSFTEYPRQIELFKNKLKFREVTRPLVPSFFFRGVSIAELQEIEFSSLPLPFIIKPTAGFCSLGVYKVGSHEEWLEVLEALMAEREETKDLYPSEVLDTDTYIIEECLEGEEFAFDAYYNAEGKPVLLGIYKHLFKSEYDMSDRVYLTSKEILEAHLEEFTEFSRELGQLIGLKNFPMHVELRRKSDGTLAPIEVNPMRFGGWCTTADTTFHAYGVNPYLYYYEQGEPQWEEILQGKEGKVFSFIVLDNSTGVHTDDILSFDYERLQATFEKPLELRTFDYRKYQLFGMLFAETRKDNFEEIERVLHADLREFITISE